MCVWVNQAVKCQCLLNCFFIPFRCTRCHLAFPVYVRRLHAGLDCSRYARAQNTRWRQRKCQCCLILNAYVVALDSFVCWSHSILTQIVLNGWYVKPLCIWNVEKAWSGRRSCQVLGNPGILAGWVLGGSAQAIGVRFFDPPVFYVKFYPCCSFLGLKVSWS